MSNINSFTETVDKLVNQVNNALNALVELNNSLTTQNDTVIVTAEQIDPVTGDPSTVTYTLPSYNYILNKLNAIHQTVDTFVKGEGVVLLNDGTYREVKTIPIAKAPDPITNVASPTKFSTKSNWFFESLMFPQIIVTFDLKGKIDDRSDRVLVKRIIFDNSNEEETDWFLDNIKGKERSYYDTIVFLNENNKRYWEDEEVYELPLKTNPYTGTFIILDKQTINEKEWYFLNTLNYGKTSDSPVINNYQLSIGNYLRYNNSVWKIDDIVTNENRIHLIPIIGVDHPTINNSFEIYTSPFSTKEINIAVGYDECNIIFLKGVNEDFNIVANDWGYGIPFWTNELTLTDSNITLEEYYMNYVMDFGKQLEGQAKERFIPAYFGETPDAPVLKSEYFAVKQINTQLNAALDVNAVKNTQTQIESLKTIINSLKNTIAQQKAQLVELTDVGERADLNLKISANVNDLAKKTVEYQSLVRSLATLAYENNIVSFEPKYRIRGFFPIPEPKGTPPQEIIQFECAYRYLRLDNTGNPLLTFEIDDPSTGQKIRGTYTDWVIIQSPIKQRYFDETLKIYRWKDEDIANGETYNINQIDIPISKGEKVEFKIRSISEAGWPLNPLKSEWSNSIIMEFPANIEPSNQVATILEESKIEEETIKLEETLSSIGIDTHIADSIPNPASGSGTYFKHQSINLAFDVKTKDKDNILQSVNTTDLQSHIENIASNTYITLTKPSGANSTYSNITGTMQQLFQSIVTICPSIYDEFVSLITT